MSTKSLVCQVRVDIAAHSHNCQANSRHRIKMGDVRLKVKKGRGWDHYCRNCALNIIDRDVKKLTLLRAMEPVSSTSNVGGF